MVQSKDQVQGPESGQTGGDIGNEVVSCVDENQIEENQKRAREEDEGGCPRQKLQKTEHPEPGQLQTRTIVIQAASAGYTSGNSADITINDDPVGLEKNENNHQRGLHIVIIDPSNYKLVAAKIFDTYKSSNAFEEFISGDHLREGFVVVAACKDECTANLSPVVKKWFTDMGSTKIEDLRYRSSFAFIGRFGKKEANEMVNFNAMYPCLCAQVLEVTARSWPQQQ